MKKLLYLTTLFGFLLFSGCGNAPKQNNAQDEETTEESGDIKASDDKIKTCDEFLDKYEEWMDDYLEVVEKYMKNPMDAEMATKYMEVAGEALNWSTQWTALYDCAGKDDYEERFDEISDKAEKKLEELGLD